ncbi:unnamed protein product [Owenia fusiformis]|uniref:N-acetyltransferase domain-containing protein n=1 Tax=Owenia fusiformis TaxID=6347 RepID=A0A8S4NJ61_OWEFU|nr:unnamed protein product [Owenia fusiformis]
MTVFTPSIICKQSQHFTWGIFANNAPVQQSSVRHSSVVQQSSVHHPTAVKCNRVAMAEFTIRKAVAEDCGDILRLVKELADYEKMPDSVIMTVEKLQEDGFGEEKYFHCFVAEIPSEEGPQCKKAVGFVLYFFAYSTWEGRSIYMEDFYVTPEWPQCRKAVGFVLYFFAYSTWEGRSIYMEDLYVTPECRGKGIGTALWKSVAKHGVEKQCVRLNFGVLDWNVKSIDFYKSKGAVDLTESEGWNSFRLTKEALESFAAS